MSIAPVVYPNGKIVYRIRVYIGKNGKSAKYICRTVNGTYTEAQIMEQQMQNARRKARMTETIAEIYRMERSIRSCNTDIRLDKAFDMSLEKPHGRDPGKERIALKRNHWSDFLAWMRKNNPLFHTLDTVTPKMAADYIGFIRRHGPFRRFDADKKNHIVSQDTVNEYHATMQQVFSDLQQDAMLPENPFSGIRKQKPCRKERNAYTPEQLNTIFAKADDYMRPLFMIGLFTGLSEGDVCTLKKSEIFFDRHYIYRYRRKTIKYSRKISAIPMMKILEDYLRVLCSDPANNSEYVLPVQAEDYLHCRSEISHKIKSFLEIDCNFTTRDYSTDREKHQSILDFHSLRHTFCSIAGSVGIPQNVVRDIVGHMDARMTELYSRHITENDGLRGIKLLENRIEELDFLSRRDKFPETSLNNFSIQTI